MSHFLILLFFLRPGLSFKVFSVDNFFLQHYHFSMNSFTDIKQHKKIFLLFLLTLCLSGLIAPLIKAFLDTLTSSSPFVRDLLNYKHGGYDFGRVMRRIMMAVAILLIFLMRKQLMIGSLVTLGIKPIRGWWEQLQMGFFLSTGMFILYVIFLWICGTQTFQPDAKSLADMIFQLLKVLLIAYLVGCIEEILFRGFIFQSLLMDLRVVSAICISSLFYSLLHFFKTKLLVSPGFQPFIGFIVIYQSFKDIIVNFTSILPSIIGLFLVGVVLSYAYFRTKSLYLAIGIHAGWIFLIKTNKLFFDHVGMNLKWLFGDSKMITGALGWSFLIFTLLLIRFVTKVPYNGKNAARTL
ncbi:MAG: CPBP family intramembrane metalloprotease [Candidatus Brocadia sp.]|nr:CPBP family intramembrane metalloprotease [Candidatus Brocadia sp.]